MNYWGNRDAMRKHALANHARMTNLCATDIQDCIKTTKEYDNAHDFANRHVLEYNTEIVVRDCTSVDALFDPDNIGTTTAVLNFASYKEPGGKYMEGSSAQEESLCHASFLYEVLCGKEGWYAWNGAHLNKALYMDRALYSPFVMFEKEDEDGSVCGYTFADVITCAAPNWSAASRYCNVSKEENDAAMLSRIRLVLHVAANHKVDTLILGAYGCGVFGQDPETVARLFDEVIREDHPHSFKRIVFAIPNASSPNHRAFAEQFCL